MLPGAVVLSLSLWGIGESTPVAVLIALHVLLGAGFSFMLTPLMTEALGALPNELDSYGSAILATLQQVAGAVGRALFVTLMMVFAAAPDVAADVSGVRAAFLCTAIVAVPVFLLVGMRRPAAAHARHPG